MIVSAHGWWVYSNKSDLEEALINNNNSESNGKLYATQDVYRLQSAGFWGHLMQTIFQVGHS